MKVLRAPCFACVFLAAFPRAAVLAQRALTWQEIRDKFEQAESVLCGRGKSASTNREPRRLRLSPPESEPCCVRRCIRSLPSQGVWNRSRALLSRQTSAICTNAAQAGTAARERLRMRPRSRSLDSRIWNELSCSICETHSFKRSRKMLFQPGPGKPFGITTTFWT